MNKIMLVKFNIKKNPGKFNRLPGFLDMSRKVIENLAVKYENVAKGVCRQMGGKVLNYEANDILKSTLLKVPHHGSKSSSTEKFLKLVNPKVALIGVGENNKFGHPNSVVLERLFNFGTVIYRTDEEGEVCINVYNDGRFKKE